MHDRILQALHQTSTAGLVASIEQAYNDAKDDDPRTIANSVAENIAKHIKISRLSPLELISLSKHCLSELTSVSSRIVVCGSRAQIPNLRIGDTIITPEGVSQIHPGFKEQVVLSKNEMSAIPLDLQPKATTSLTIFDMSDVSAQSSEQPALTKALNKACVKKPNSLYIARQSSPEIMHAEDVMRSLHRYHLIQEIKHRHLFDILYKAFNVTTDIQFTNIADNLYKEFLAVYASKGEVPGADEYKAYLTGTLPNKINFTKLSNNELTIISYSGFHYTPQRSSKIIRSGSIQAINDSGKLEYGDTFILPNGVYQMDHNGTKQTILSDVEMKRALPAGMIPNEDSALEIIEPISQFINPDEPLIHQLPSNINMAILLTNTIQLAIQDKPNAMSLGTVTSDESPISTVIYRAQALDRLQNTMYDQPGATFLVPEGVFQVDASGTLQTILNQEEMQAIPAHIREANQDTVESIPCLNEVSAIERSNQHALLTQSLLRGIVNKPNALYLGASMGQAANQVVDVTSSIHYLAEQELQRRQIKTNLILKMLRVKNNADFMNYFMTRLFPGKMTAAELVKHITKVLVDSKRIDVTGLTDDELRMVVTQCDHWRPNVSPRILCCKTFPKNARIGDTVILPDGVYQIRIDEISGKVKPEKIINESDLLRLDIVDFIPDSTSEIRIIEDYNTEHGQELLSVLNPIIKSLPQAMYLHEENETYMAVTAALKQMAEKELASRAENVFKKTEVRSSPFQFLTFSLFGKRKIVPSTTQNSVEEMGRIIPSQTQAKPSIEKKMNIRQLRTGASRLKQLQKALQEPSNLSRRITPSSALMMAQTNGQENIPRSVHDVQTAMRVIKEELTWKLRDSDFTVAKMQDEQTVHILQDQRVVMAASRDTVAMYKPLLQEKSLKDTKKAELFLQALGVPPTYGKHKVEVRGGHHNLRKAIRALFQEYKKIEQSQQESALDMSQHESDSGSSFQK